MQMKIFDLLLMSITNLWKRKLRTILTVLGVVIGITSIVVMIALGNGLKVSMMENISSYSSITQIEVNSSNYYASDSSSDTKLLNDSLVNEIKAMEHVTAVYPELNVSVLAKTGKYISWMQLTGMSEDALDSLNLTVEQGELPKEGSEVTLFYGNSVITDFYVEKTGRYPYWENNELADIDLMEDPIFIIYDTNAYYNSQNSNTPTSSEGTSQKKAKKYITKTAGIMAGSVDEWTMTSNRIYCEINTLKAQLKKVFKKEPIPNQPTRKNGKAYNEIFYSRLTVQVDDIENVAALTKVLNDMGYNAYNDAEWIESQTQQLNVIQVILGAIGAVSLLVAAIGITNTMMMSIYERTKEIGVMKVLGCDIHNIQTLFLMEAGFIGLIGGIVGVGFSAGIGALLNHLMVLSGMNEQMGITTICIIPVWLPVLAILFAIVIGMVAGFLPSLRAMRLSPLAAIRNE